jgi:MFS superfamily sulfate permease-like transporter
LARGPAGAYVSIDRHDDVIPVPGIAVLRMDAPLLFLNAKHLRDEVRATVRDGAWSVRVVLLDLAMSAELDVESRDVLDALARQVRDLGAELWLVDVRAPVASMLARPDAAGETVDLPTYPTMDAAMSAYAARESRPGDEVALSARR